MAAFAGVCLAYLAWQYPKSPFEQNRFVAKETTPTPTPTPTLTPTPTPSPSATPKVKAKQRKVARGANPHQQPQQERCYKTDENGNILYDKGGYEMEVDCETGEDIDEQ